MRSALLCSVLSAAASAPLPSALSGLVPLRVVGLGRYAGAPAVFLSDGAEAASPAVVLPVPVPLDAVMGLEQALSGMEQQAMMDVLLHCRGIASRDGGLFDSLPWDWAPSALAKRDGYARLQGRGFPRGGYRSPYGALLDVARLDACADVSHVLIEQADALDGTVIGGAVLAARLLPAAVNRDAVNRDATNRDAVNQDAANRDAAPDEAARAFSVEAARRLEDGSGPAEPRLCECTADEAVGFAVALGCAVFCDERVWRAGRVQASYSMQRGRMRIQVEPGEGRGGQSEGEQGKGGLAVPPPLPWEVRSVAELRQMPLRDKARSAMAAGLRLPRPRGMSDQVRAEWGGLNEV